MPFTDLNTETQRSIERFDATFQIQRMHASKELWPEFEIELRSFGKATAVRMKPAFFRKNLVVGFTESDLEQLPEILSFFRETQTSFILSLPYDGSDNEIFDALSSAGMRCDGNGHVMAIVPFNAPPIAGIEVRLSTLDEKDLYLDLYRRSFSTQREVTEEEMRFQWMNDTLTGAQRFVAEIDGPPVGMASINVFDGVAYLSTAGVLPEYRGRGVQQALIRARVSAAHAVGCSVAMGGGSIFSPPMRNFSRCGFSLLPLGVSWWWSAR